MNNLWVSFKENIIKILNKRFSSYCLDLIIDIYYEGYSPKYLSTNFSHRLLYVKDY